MIDCHCHFDMMDNPEGVIAQMDRLGHTVIGMTNRPCYFKEGIRKILCISKSCAVLERVTMVER